MGGEDHLEQLYKELKILLETSPNGPESVQQWDLKEGSAVLNPPGRDASGRAEKGMTAAWLRVWIHQKIGTILVDEKEEFWLLQVMAISEVDSGRREDCFGFKKKIGSLAYGKIIWVFKF